ncbi:MAG: methyltransferase domain-containing protein [Salaquimonas sp.]
MSVDVVDLREFYATPLGQTARDSLVTAINKVGGLEKELELVGLGYPVPIFDKIAVDNPNAIILMPARQGALQWPRGANPKTALVDEDQLPIETASVECVVVLHLLENALDPSHILNEIWRILVPEGKLILVATNRRGLWARFEHTPFGNGRPFSRGQLGTLLRKAKLTPSLWDGCLNFPPARYKKLIRTFAFVDKIGHRLWPIFCGALLVVAKKRLYQGVPVKAKSRSQLKVPALAAQGARQSAQQISQPLETSEAQVTNKD